MSLRRKKFFRVGLARKVNTGGAWLSSARDANCSVKSDNERNPRDLFGEVSYFPVKSDCW